MNKATIGKVITKSINQLLLWIGPEKTRIELPFSTWPKGALEKEQTCNKFSHYSYASIRLTNSLQDWYTCKKFENKFFAGMLYNKRKHAMERVLRVWDRHICHCLCYLAYEVPSNVCMEFTATIRRYVRCNSTYVIVWKYWSNGCFCALCICFKLYQKYFRLLVSKFLYFTFILHIKHVKFCIEFYIIRLYWWIFWYSPNIL